MQDMSLVGCTDTIRRGDFLADTYSQVIDIPQSSHQDLISLPPLIPGISTGLQLKHLPTNSVVAISLGDIIGRGGELLVTNIRDVKLRFGLPVDSRVVLIGTAKDSAIEKLWKISDSHNIWKRISRVGFEWVTSLTYSVWDEMPRVDQIRNQDRNFQTHDRFSNLGTPCIPFLFPFEKSDYVAAQEWFRKRPDINKVAIEAQSHKSPRRIARLIKDMKAIEQAAGKRLQFVVVGPSTATRICTMLRHFSATIVTWKPFHEARTGSICDVDLCYSKSLLTREELVYLNFQRYETFGHLATKQHLRNTA